jgi:hypothetical protein
MAVLTIALRPWGRRANAPLLGSRWVSGYPDDVMVLLLWAVAGDE